MRVLTYKRTHTGDPTPEGQFGVNDCMGRVRGWSFDAVIGVGGYGTEPREHAIEGRVTWVGVGPAWAPHPEGYGQIVTFDSFVLLDSKGPRLEELAPLLARRMYEKKARILLKSYSPCEKAEAIAVIAAVLGNASSHASPSHLRKKCRQFRSNMGCVAAT